MIWEYWGKCNHTYIVHVVTKSGLNIPRDVDLPQYDNYIRITADVTKKTK